MEQLEASNMLQVTATGYTEVVIHIASYSWFKNDVRDAVVQLCGVKREKKNGCFSCCHDHAHLEPKQTKATCSRDNLS